VLCEALDKANANQGFNSFRICLTCELSIDRLNPTPSGDVSDIAEGQNLNYEDTFEIVGEKHNSLVEGRQQRQDKTETEIS
jgi:hypothetical protein